MLKSMLRVLKVAFVFATAVGALCGFVAGVPGAKSHPVGASALDLVSAFVLPLFDFLAAYPLGALLCFLTLAMADWLFIRRKEATFDAETDARVSEFQRRNRPDGRRDSAGKGKPSRRVR